MQTPIFVLGARKGLRDCQDYSVLHNLTPFCSSWCQLQEEALIPFPPKPKDKLWHFRFTSWGITTYGSWSRRYKSAWETLERLTSSGGEGRRYRLISLVALGWAFVQWISNRIFCADYKAALKTLLAVCDRWLACQLQLGRMIGRSSWPPAGTVSTTLLAVHILYLVERSRVNAQCRTTGGSTRDEWRERMARTVVRLCSKLL